MLNRRLIVLFIAFALGFCALALRLTTLQVVRADEFRRAIREWGHRAHQIETYRGAILDRNGVPIAQDVPSDELAIDYRAMNLDDSWLTRTAIERLKTSGEWATLPDRAARQQRIADTKADLAEKIDNIPAAIAQVCQIPREDVLDRFQDIRARIHALRQDIWSRRFDREAARIRSAATQNAQSGSGGLAGKLSTWWDSLWNRSDLVLDDDKTYDTSFRETQVQEELVAHTIRSNIPAPIANYFRQHIAEFPGLVVRDKANRRDYPFGESLAHISGTLGPVDRASVDARPFHFPNLMDDDAPADAAAGAGPGQVRAGGGGEGNLGGYLPGDRQGETGAEKLLEPLLRGTRGARVVDLTDQGDESPTDSQRVDPQPGQNVRLTIDAAFQRDLYAAITDPGRGLLKGKDGKTHFVGLVVLSLDGQILGMISYPSYDPNTIDDTRLVLNNDAWRRPLYSRAFREVYPPGSTVKPLLASAALTEGVISPDESITCIGHFFPSRTDIFRCDAESGHGPIRLVDAIAQSCNVYFYTVGQRLGLERLSAWYSRYGFGRDTGMELSEAKGHVPTPSIADPDAAKADALFLGIGQGPVDVTPLQMANAYATLLRGGRAIAPRILFDTPPHETQDFVLASDVVETIRRGMERCTTSGTGKSVFRSVRLPVAGKTGTAEKWRLVFDDNGNPVDDPARPLKNADGTPILKPDGTPACRQKMDEGTDAWFIGYAPADNPKFIVAAVMEWGGHGGAYAAPMVKEAFLQLEKHNYLPHTDIP